MCRREDRKESVCRREERVYERERREKRVLGTDNLSQVCVCIQGIYRNHRKELDLDDTKPTNTHNYIPFKLTNKNIKPK